MLSGEKWWQEELHVRPQLGKKAFQSDGGFYAFIVQIYIPNSASF